MLKILVSSYIIFISIQYATSSRILAMIPSASYSHQVFYHQLWREFALRGHEITVITTDPTNETLPNFKEINIHETYVPTKRFITELIETSMLKMFITNKVLEIKMENAEFALRLPQVQELINNKDEHFDVVIIEHILGPAIALKHRFNCPMIGVLSMDGLDPSHYIMGNAVHAVLYPSLMFGIDANSSIFMRTLAFMISEIIHIASYRSKEKLDRITRDIFGEDTPSPLEITQETDMLFVNANPLFSAVRPVTPSTISLAGGMHMKPAKPLPKDLQKFLDEAKEGAIFFSLGSNVKSNELTLEMRQIILKTLGQLPYKVLWKFEDDSLVGKPNNVHLTKWAPQQDILRHKNVKLFITQCGIQSLEEALYLHVPIVAMPFFGDQEGNAMKAEKKGMGVVIDRKKLSVEGLKSAILEVIENPVYRDTVTRLATQIQDTPMTALERAIWWTEYVLRHKGAQHLKGPLLPWYQYYYLDVLSLIGVVIMVILGSVYFSIRFFIRKLLGFKEHSSKKKQQ